MEKVKTFWWPLKVKNIGQYFPNELDMNPVPSSSFSKRQMLYICMKQDGVDKYIQYLKTHRKEGNTRVEKIVVNSKFFLVGILELSSSSSTSSSGIYKMCAKRIFFHSYKHEK